MADSTPRDRESDERDRIDAIMSSGVFDAPPNPQLDRITRMAARVFDVPIVMATVIDSDSIWIKSSVGFEPRCLARADGLCETVIETGRFVHRYDARQHPVAKLHPLVDTDTGIVFYAGAPVRDAEGRVLGTFCIADHHPRAFSEREQQSLQDFADWVVDLIQRRRAELERDADRRRYRAIIENPTVSVSEIDESGIVLNVNQAALTLSGYDRSELVGHSYLKYVDPDFQSATLAGFESVSSGGFIELDLDLIHKDGSIHTYDISACPFQIASGETHAIVMMWDISEESINEAKVVIAEKRYRQLFETSRDAMAFLSPVDGRHVEVNGAYCRMTGHSKEALEQMLFTDLSPTEITPERVRGYLEELRTTGVTQENERELRHKDGSVIPVSTCAWLLTDDQDEPLAILSRARDISEQKRLEIEQAQQQDHLEAQVAERTRELEDSLTRLRRAERLASVGTLASGLAHQINNPIGSILNSAEYALMCEDDENVNTIWKGALLESVEQARRCGRIVHSMLQYSRGEPTERWPEDLGVVLQRALNATQSYAKARQATIKVSEDERPTPVMVNPIEMEQVLVNIINNAIESNAAGANIAVRLVAREKQVYVAITDDGRGISPENTSRVLDPFYTTRQREGGTGLGLSVAVGIVDEFGGTLTVESEPDTGTTVTIAMPLAASMTTPEERL